MAKTKILMFEHGGSDNRGCEAIVRTTCSMLGDNKYYLQSFNKNGDIIFGLNRIVKLIEVDKKVVSRNSLAGFFLRLKSRLSHKYSYDQLETLYKNRKLKIKPKFALSIGGDNYCYKSSIDSISEKLFLFREKGIPVVLWGCSLDCQTLDSRSIEELKQYSLITVRETLSKESLSQAGIVDNVVLCSDPAFTLPRQTVDWNNDILECGNVIGLNVSGMMQYYHSYPNATYNNFRNLIKHILTNTNSYIVLIPHVYREGHSDIEVINNLAKEINDSRILIVDKGYNCMQLKDIIARCRMFVGCRTHSTIAAYSSCVPTLVVGYSIKSKGIAKDIFGNYEDLVIDATGFKTDNDLTEKFIGFAKREEEIRFHLKKVMPEYIQKAYVASDAVKEMFGLK